MKLRFTKRMIDNNVTEFTSVESDLRTTLVRLSIVDEQYKTRKEYVTCYNGNQFDSVANKGVEITEVEYLEGSNKYFELDAVSDKKVFVGNTIEVFAPHFTVATVRKEIGGKVLVSLGFDKEGNDILCLISKDDII